MLFRLQDMKQPSIYRIWNSSVIFLPTSSQNSVCSPLRQKWNFHVLVHFNFRYHYYVANDRLDYYKLSSLKASCFNNGCCLFQSTIKIWNYLEFLHKDITKASVPYLKITSTQNVAVLLCLFELKSFQIPSFPCLKISSAQVVVVLLCIFELKSFQITSFPYLMISLPQNVTVLLCLFELNSF